MLIIGKKYIFNEIEKEKLKDYNLEYIKIDENLIPNIKNKLKNKKYKLIILNTNKKLSNETIEKLTSFELKGIKFLSIEHFLEKYLNKIFIPKDNSNLNFLEEIKPFSKWQYFQKRTVDYFISIPLAICSIPIMLYSIYSIKKESPEGEIIFKQKRVGLNGKEFVCYKFRSMIPDAEKGKPKFASKDDPRVFKWGATMRKTRIDELPQLWNVLNGDMHLIGPRPERKYWVDQFKKNIPSYDQRHLIRPGITGWAQVNYPYGANEEDARQKLMYDLYYIKNWSLWLEIKTIFKTILVMVGRKGL